MPTSSISSAHDPSATHHDQHIVRHLRWCVNAYRRPSGTPPIASSAPSLSLELNAHILASDLDGANANAKGELRMEGVPMIAALFCGDDLCAPSVVDWLRLHEMQLFRLNEVCTSDW